MIKELLAIPAHIFSSLDAASILLYANALICFWHISSEDRIWINILYTCLCAHYSLICRKTAYYPYLDAATYTTHNAIILYQTNSITSILFSHQMLVLTAIIHKLSPQALEYSLCEIFDEQRLDDLIYMQRRPY
jgi:hypothetical protein